MAKKPKRPRDPNHLAKLITDIAVGDAQEADDRDGKNPAAVARGIKGGLRGGKSRMNALTPEERQDLARKAAEARWREKAPAVAGASRPRSAKQH